MGIFEAGDDKRRPEASRWGQESDRLEVSNLWTKQIVLVLPLVHPKWNSRSTYVLVYVLFSLGAKFIEYQIYRAVPRVCGEVAGGRCQSLKSDIGDRLELLSCLNLLSYR
jgi:hypothetical protein